MGSIFIAFLGFTLLIGTSAQLTTTGSSSSNVSPIDSTPSNPSAASSPAVSTSLPVTSSLPIYSTSQPPAISVDYSVTDPITKTVCIMLKGTFKFSLPYITVNNVSSSSGDYYLSNNGSTVHSSCNQLMGSVNGQLLKVTDFFEDWSFQIFYQNNSNSFVATSLQLDYNVQRSSLFIDAPVKPYKASVMYIGSTSNPLFIAATIPGYYICHAESIIKLNATSGENGKVYIRELTTFAFGAQNTTGLTGTKTQCAADAAAADYIVPIVVGCALAAIILVVLVAYIIGRYRSRNTYQTV